MSPLLRVPRVGRNSRRWKGTEKPRQRLGSTRAVREIPPRGEEMQKTIEAVKCLHPLGFGNMVVAIGAEFFLG